jgi:hypothetical protein
MTMATTPVSLDLDSATVDRLAERERETGQSQSELAQRYIEEGLRMERHPGIVFRDGPTGRRAALLGGPDVWEMMPTVLEAEGDLEDRIQIAIEWHGLSEQKVRAAIAYYQEFPDEIDARIAKNRAMANEHYATWRAEHGLPPE